MKGTVILGAGPTGLGAAYRLTERGETDFEIYERAPRVHQRRPSSALLLQIRFWTSLIATCTT